MSESERIDELAPIIAGIGRLAAGGVRAAGSAIRSLAKKKATEKAEEKVKSQLETYQKKLAGRNAEAEKVAARNREIRKDVWSDMEEACWKGYEKKGAKNWGNSRKDEALHTAYKNFIMEAMTGPDGKGLSPEDVASAGMNARAKKADKREQRIKNKKAAIAMKQKQQRPSLLSRASNRVNKFMADRKEAAEQKAIKKGEAERKDAEQKKYLKDKAAEEKTEIARQKRVEAFGKNRKRVEDRRLRAEKNKVRDANVKAKAAEKIAAIEKSATDQNKSQRGTDQTLVGRGIDRLKDRVVDFGTAKGLRTGLSKTRQSILQGRAAMKAGRERVQFQHTEYHRIGSILAEKSAAWTRSEGKNPSGGLNAKGVASYRAQNPGSKLKTAVTTKPSKLKKGSKAANRRKSFCARMKGMRKRQKSSNNTGKDRLSLSLKKWNC